MTYHVQWICRCWDGKNVDSPNHRDHVSYAINASFGNFGTGCPSTHPVTIPLLFLETYWDTTPFNNEPGAFANGKQPFVWSMGDPYVLLIWLERLMLMYPTALGTDTTPTT